MDEIYKKSLEEIRKKIDEKYRKEPRARILREGSVFPRKKNEVTIEELEKIFESLER